MTTLQDKKKLMLRLMQQNTDDYKKDIIIELINSAYSCMFAGNEAWSAEFMQNILFTSGKFTLLTVAIPIHCSYHMQAISLLC